MIEQTSISTRLREVQEFAEDFEWYPTTDEILDVVSLDLSERLRHGFYSNLSLLDIGAGNGKALTRLKNDVRGLGTLLAVEKSQTHRQYLPAEVFILGVDFHKTTLLDKEVDVIFSNPPYSEYLQWSEKIITEAKADSLVYLVIPERWETTSLPERLKARKASHELLGTFDFENAERKARARVHVLAISIPSAYKGQDPFYAFFDANFTYPSPDPVKPLEEEVKEQMVSGGSMIDVLCRLYDERMHQLQENYTAICALDPTLLEEFEIRKSDLVKSLGMKIQAAKKEYWGRLFDAIKIVNTRLTHATRQKLLNKLNAQTGIEFNSENAYAILEWVLKNANIYLDEQLIDTFERLMEFVNVEAYVSNDKVFHKQGFRYHYRCRDEDCGPLRLKVGHRIVLEHCGGLEGRFFYDCPEKSLSERAAHLIGDLLVLANNLGFPTIENPPSKGEWDDSAARVYHFGPREDPRFLFDVRAFKNGNLHFRFHPPFVHALNIQYGRLKGWLRDEHQAAYELQIDPGEAQRHFASEPFRFTRSTLALTG